MWRSGYEHQLGDSFRDLAKFLYRSSVLWRVLGFRCSNTWLFKALSGPSLFTPLVVYSSTYSRSSRTIPPQPAPRPARCAPPTPTRPREAAPSWLVIATLGTLARMAGRAQEVQTTTPRPTSDAGGARSDCHHAVALKRDVAPRHFCRVISKENPRHRDVSLFHFQTFRV